MTPPVTGKEDIVERLRHEADQWHPSEKAPIRVLRDAADYIEQSRRSSGVERGAVIEECARVAERMVVVGHAWSHDQRVAAEALLDCAKFIRSLREAGGGEELGRATPRDAIATELLEALKGLNKAYLGVQLKTTNDRMPAILAASQRAHAATARAERALATRGEANPSPSAREAQLREAIEWAMNEIDVLSNKLVQFAYPQGMGMIGREDQFEQYRSACKARALAAKE